MEEHPDEGGALVVRDQVEDLVDVLGALGVSGEKRRLTRMGRLDTFKKLIALRVKQV